MQLRHVEYFVATADTGSVTAAAARCRVTQPALSRQLRQLEHDLGVELLDRGVGRLVPSRTGRALLPAARELLRTAAALERTAALHARGRVDRLTIAAPTVTLTDVVSPFVATLGVDEPVVDVLPADDRTPAELVAAGADLAIGSRRPPAPVASRALARLPVWAYVGPDDPWAQRSAVTLAELVARPLVVPPTTSHAREALDVATAAAGLSPAGLLEAANGTIAQALAASGRGVAVVSDDARFGLVPVGVELDTPGRTLHVSLVAAWDADGLVAPTVAALVERLASWVVERYGESVRPPT